MIRALAFDLDGVLVDACDLHRKAFRYALVDVLSYHLSVEDEERLEGRPTKAKLALLGIVGATAEAVARRKQEITASLIPETIRPNPFLRAALEKLRRKYVVGCVSNSIRSTVEDCLSWAHLEVELIVSNEDVLYPKPDPAGYSAFMDGLGLDPSEVLIFEDSSVGLAAAKASGAHVAEVTSPETLTYGFVLKEIARCNC
jgi:HAD superfamily hydrolase (TIGR01509 family)